MSRELKSQWYDVQHESVGRSLSVFGLTANGLTDGWGGGALRLGITQSLDGWLIQPSIGIGGFAFAQNDLTETGVLAETVGNQNLGSAQSTVGASLQRSFALSDSVQMVAKGQLGWAYEFVDNAASVQANFVGFTGDGFQVTSAPIGRNAALVGVDADFTVADWPVAIFAGYGGAYNSSSNTQAFTAGLRFTW
jgi:uncharacterized protein with beta-barrel porin domain